MYKGQVMKGSLCPPNAETIMGGARGKMEALRGWGNRNKDKNIKKQDLTLLTEFELNLMIAELKAMTTKLLAFGGSE